jgi:general secretion pathway protein A
MDQIHEFLIEQYAAQKRVALIVDEAQNLSPKLLEEIRMLSNLEAEKSHLIQIILVGQPELKVKLRRSDLKQFVQRVTVHYHLNALNQNEVEKYIKYRLKIGGAKQPNHFDNDAIEAISKYSRGIPRLINILCDTSLVYGFAESKPKIDKKIVEDVVKERAAGGILSIDDTGDHENAAQPLIDDIYDDAPAGEHNELRLLKKRIDLIEQKSDLLEKTIHEMNNALSRLSGKKDEKDALLLELFKMLKNNMDSRMKTLVYLNNTQAPFSLKK